MIKMLVIDDERGVCDVIKKTFTYIGFSVFLTDTVKSALEIMEKEHPQIVFLNIVMSDTGGIDALKEIKQKYPDIIVLMITAKDDDTVRNAARAAGVDEFIAKPFRRNYLQDVVVQKIGDILYQKGHMQVPVILLVDDESEFRKTLRDFISHRYECVIEEADEGTAAVEAVGRVKPDIVFLDIKMPGLSGMDVIAQIKKISPLSKIIIISAWKSAEVVSQAISKGATDYLSKPISLSVLNEKLKWMLIRFGKMKEKTA